MYVTHDQVEALTMGDRVAVLKDGVLLQVDSANDLYEYPGSVFVGEFIGSPKMNVVEGTLDVSGGTVTVECLGVRADVTDRVTGRLADGVATRSRAGGDPAARPAPRLGRGQRESRASPPAWTSASTPAPRSSRPWTWASSM